MGKGWQGCKEVPGLFFKVWVERPDGGKNCVRFGLVEKTAGASKGTTFSVVCRTLGPLPAKLVPSPSKTRRPVLEFGDRGPAILQSPSGCDPGYDRRQGALRCFHLTQGPVISRAMSTLCRGPVAADVGTASFIACQHGAYSNLLAIFEAFVQRLGKT